MQKQVLCISQTKRMQNMLNFDSVRHLGDKSTFTCLCWSAKAAADLWKGIDCIKQIMRLSWESSPLYFWFTKHGHKHVDTHLKLTCVANSAAQFFWRMDPFSVLVSVYKERLMEKPEWLPQSVIRIPLNTTVIDLESWVSQTSSPNISTWPHRCSCVSIEANPCIYILTSAGKTAQSGSCCSGKGRTNAWLMPMALKQAHMVWCSSVLQTNFPNQYFLLVFNWKYLYTRYTIAQKFGDGKIFKKRILCSHITFVWIKIQ